MNRNKQIGTLAFFAGLVVMAITNPARPIYVDYATEQLVQEIKQNFCDRGNQQIQIDGLLTFDLPQGEDCRSLLAAGDFLGRGLLKTWVDHATTRQNFVVFSLYTTQTPGKTFKTIGMFNNFVTFYAR